MGRFDGEQQLRRQLTRAESRLRMVVRELRALRADPDSEEARRSADGMLQIAKSWEVE